jgi:hypothetical protein
MTFEELAPDLNTGDVFLFHGTEWTSRIIEDVTHSVYSHVAMIVRQPGSTGTDGLSFWQSWEPTGGVAVFDALPFLQQYDTAPGEFTSARLLNVTRTPAMLAALASFEQSVNGRPFPSITDLVLHWIEGRNDINSGTDNFFCSQLLALTYTQMGLLPTSPVPNSYSPEAFSESNPGLPLQLGASLGPQIPITV